MPKIGNLFHLLLRAYNLDRAVGLLRDSGKKWLNDKCLQLGAALAYYTIFSLAPLVLVLLSILGLIFGSSEQARNKMIEQIQYLVDPSAVQVIKDIATNVSHPSSSLIGAITGILIALLGAAGVFGQLQDALNTIWSVKPKPGGGLGAFLKARFLSFAMVAGVCFLLLVSLAVEGLLKGFSGYLQHTFPGGDKMAFSIYLFSDLVIIVLLFAMIFRFLPDAKITWHDVWVGSVLTAVLFLVGKYLLGIYFSFAGSGSAYGAAGSLVTLLLWIYYSSLIVLFGAEFTAVYATEFGSRVEPDKEAVKVERREEIVKQG